MKKILIINEEERSRILNMHENATKRHYLSEAAPFGTKFVLDKNYQLLGHRGLPSFQLPKGSTWVFDGAKATLKGGAGGKDLIFRCDRPAGGVNEKGVKFMFTDGTYGHYTYDNSLETNLNKQFCIVETKTDTKPEPKPVRTNVPNDKVKELQKKLNTLPNVISVTGSKLSEDGIFGSKTLEAALIALSGPSPESIKSIETPSITTTTPETLPPQSKTT